MFPVSSAWGRAIFLALVKTEYLVRRRKVYAGTLQRWAEGLLLVTLTGAV